MFGLVDLVVRAERDMLDTPMNMRSEPRSERQVGLWRHKILWLAAAGVLALLLIGGKAL